MAYLYLLHFSHKPDVRLPLLPARPTVTFPTAVHHCRLAGSKLQRLVTEAHVCEQLAESHYMKVEVRPIVDLLIANSKF